MIRRQTRSTRTDQLFPTATTFRSCIVVALVILLSLGVPAARITERRWYHLSRQALASWGLHARFRRDVRRLCVAALALPFLWVSGAMAATQAIAAVAG